MRNMKYYRFFVFLFLFNFQVFADEFAHQLVVVAAGEGVGRAWIDHLVKLNLSILQSQRKAPGVGRMDVVIQLTMYQEEFAVQVGRFGGDMRDLIAFGVVLRRIHIALGVDGVVVALAGDGAAGDTCAKEGVAGHHPEGHAASIAVAAQADALFIDEGE